MVNKITDLRYIVVNSEQDALLLENNLIKKYKPRYNILLKDDNLIPGFVLRKNLIPGCFLPAVLYTTDRNISVLILRENLPMY